MPHQEIPRGGLRSFFERFHSLNAASDVEGLAAMYAGSVMIAGPNGAQIVRAADIGLAIPKRKHLLELAGHRDTSLVGFEETALTGRYSLVRAQFRWHFQAANGPVADVNLPSIFIVDRAGASPHIVLYMNEQDVVSVLRERGAVPPA